MLVTYKPSFRLVGRMNCVHPGWGFVLRSYAGAAARMARLAHLHAGPARHDRSCSLCLCIIYVCICVYVGVHRRHPFAVWTTFFHSPEGVPQSNAWISAADCPARANRWECAFLPSTNCSVPEAIAHCDPRYGDCNAYTNTWMSALLTAANQSGQFESPQHDRIMQHGQQPADERQQVSSQQEPTYPCTLT